MILLYIFLGVIAQTGQLMARRICTLGGTQASTVSGSILIFGYDRLPWALIVLAWFGPFRRIPPCTRGFRVWTGTGQRHRALIAYAVHKMLSVRMLADNKARA